MNSKFQFLGKTLASALQLPDGEQLLILSPALQTKSSRVLCVAKVKDTVEKLDRLAAGAGIDREEALIYNICYSWILEWS